uniref:Uncharacterized protein TCIL3000_4_1780 n=1 Tax=Trypanosoma congolense (strain IL3000) TaxID=1068625 RepID=G0UL35_TRYCI|nr:unnamed protein product [Trypanosoma congolense IL3000]
MPPYPSRDEYRLVRKTGGEKEKGQGPENEIRVAATHGAGGCITYAIALLRGEDGKTQHDTVKISAMGSAIRTAVYVAEVLRRRVPGLHQTIDISSEVIRDEYEGIGEKKDKVEVERKVSTILITLSLKPLDTKHIGYQAPLPESEVREEEREYKAPRGRGRGGRGGRGRRGGGRGGFSDSGDARGE